MLSVNMRSASELTKAVNLLPVKPTYFGGIGLFEEKGSRTTSVTLDVRHGRFVLVPRRPLPGAGASGRRKPSRPPTCRFRTYCCLTTCRTCGPSGRNSCPPWTAC